MKCSNSKCDNTVIMSIGVSTTKGIVIYCSDCMVQGIYELLNQDSSVPKMLPCSNCHKEGIYFSVIGSVDDIHDCCMYCSKCANKFCHSIPQVPKELLK